jgi:hypothetical protein
MPGILERVKCSEDLKKLTIKEMNVLAAEIRELLITSVSRCGGHLAPNIFLAALALKGGNSAAVAAVPIISKNIPRKIIASSNINATSTLFTALTRASDPRLTKRAIKNVIKATRNPDINMFFLVWPLNS